MLDEKDRQINAFFENFVQWRKDNNLPYLQDMVKQMSTPELQEHFWQDMKRFASDG